MKVIQINCVYKNGSTGKIVYDIHKELENNGITSIVCYGRGKKINDKNVYKVCSEVYSKINHFFLKFTGVIYDGCNISTYKLKKIIKKENPDVIHLHCINGYFVNIYKLITFLKKKNIKTVLTLHAEFMYTGGCGHSIDCNKWQDKNGCNNCPIWKKEFHTYVDGTKKMWNKMNNAFKGFEKNLTVVSVSPWLMNRAKNSQILNDFNHITVLNGLDDSIFYKHSTDEIVKLKKELNIGIDEKVVFHATPNFNNDINHIKGGYYVLKLAKLLPNIKFVIAGPVNENVKTPNNIITLGKISDQCKLAQLYSMADVTLLTSRRETFSMVTAESLCCGTPVVGFKAGGPESIAIDKYCHFVEYGNVEQLKKSVKKMISNNKQLEISKESVKKYSKKVMVESYIKIYKDLIEQKKKGK